MYFLLRTDHKMVSPSTAWFPFRPLSLSSQAVYSNHSTGIQKHLQSIFNLLRPEDTLKMVSLSLPGSRSTLTPAVVIVARDRLCDWKACIRAGCDIWWS